MITSIDKFEVLPWNKNFETGNSIIDAQHKVLVDLLNNLAVTLVNQDEVKLNTTFDELIAYANMHFADEEEIWLKYFPDDPWFLSHKKTHTSFLPSVMDIKKNVSGDTLTETTEKIVRYLLQWLVFHIIDTDKRMVIALNALELGATIDEAKNLAEEEMKGSKQILIDAILNMYGELSSRTIEAMREMKARKEAEERLNETNTQLQKLIITDPLTSLFNRRHFDSTFKLQLRKSIRGKTALCLMLLDIDFFKGINDYYGHLVGDQALQQLSACLQELCRRPDDMAFRIGGEEFCILTTGESKDSVEQFAEKIRATVEGLKIPNKQSEVSSYMTISIGVAYKIPRVGDNQDEFINVADKRLYQAKASGRNKVISSH